MEPYTGPWTKQEAGHLLARATFGATFETLRTATEQGLEATLDQLLTELPLPTPPIAEEDDGITPAGESWTEYAYPENVGERIVAVRIRKNSFRSWLNKLRVEEGISARETMVLFWHDHFANDLYQDVRWNYLHSTLLRENAFGDFRQLVKDVTVDPVMLAFLNGNQNTVRRPNENYARELLELFTVGKGPQVGPGDYTNYTEEDVVAMARSLTGWRTQRTFASDVTLPLTAEFVPARHDAEAVQLSPRFGSIQFPSTGETTYQRLVDLIFEKDAAAEFLARKLYRWFVYYEITDAVEANVIQPLAALLRANDYVVGPVVRTLLGSQHFFDVQSQGPMIKHPIQYVVGLVRQFAVIPVNPNNPDQQFYNALFVRADQMGMGDFRAPSVSGWPAFYQEPLFYRSWINSSTLALRNKMINNLFRRTPGIQGYGVVDFSLLALVRQFPDPVALWPMIDEWVSLLFPRPIPEGQREALRELLLPGLPETQWSVEYATLLANPNDEGLATSLENNLRRMVRAMTEMPEYQLI
ncbi:hypothetical protein A3850_018740 [Lewinella sp. 4G2]|nr:hypothetical protein A3850_018740 [Lewinella sp. 4G2]